MRTYYTLSFLADDPIPAVRVDYTLVRRATFWHEPAAGRVRKGRLLPRFKVSLAV